MGRPSISAPPRSASYSREREMAICTSIAASGARTTINMVPMKPKGLLLSRFPPPNSRPKLASMEMAPAMVAVMVMVRVS